MDIHKAKPTSAPVEVLAAIAKEHLSIETLETRKSDSLDFHDCAVWCLKSALAAAYEAGRRNRRIIKGKVMEKHWC